MRFSWHSVEIYTNCAPKCKIAAYVAWPCYTYPSYSIPRAALFIPVLHIGPEAVTFLCESAP